MNCIPNDGSLAEYTDECPTRKCRCADSSSRRNRRRATCGKGAVRDGGQVSPNTGLWPFRGPVLAFYFIVKHRSAKSSQRRPEYVVAHGSVQAEKRSPGLRVRPRCMSHSDQMKAFIVQAVERTVLPLQRHSPVPSLPVGMQSVLLPPSDLAFPLPLR